MVKRYRNPLKGKKYVYVLAGYPKSKYMTLESAVIGATRKLMSIRRAKVVEVLSYRGMRLVAHVIRGHGGVLHTELFPMRKPRFVTIAGKGAKRERVQEMRLQ